MTMTVHDPNCLDCDDFIDEHRLVEPDVDECYDVPRGVCHECDKPLGTDKVEAQVTWHDEDGWHHGRCWTHERCRR